MRLAFALAALGLLLLASGARAAGPEVVLLPTTGIVDDGMASYVAGGISQAESDGAAAVIIELDTPGGSLTSTQDIVTAILQSKVPIIVWVAPAGGYAASAGTFITLSSNIALMAPGTRIGAASPVGSQGEDITGTEGTKVMNDAIAYITEIATIRHRNVTWAVSAVQDAKSSPATEAAATGVVDGEASTIDDVLAFANGKTVSTASGDVTLNLAGATTVERDMNPFLAFIRLLSDPTIAFLLFSAGSIGLLAELWSPNFVTGILGAIVIILSLIGLGALPLNVGGLLLIVLAMVMFGLELTVTSHGLLGFGGVVCLALGSSALFNGPVDPFGPVVSVAQPVIITVVVTWAAFMALVVVAAVRSRRWPAPAMAGSPAAVPPGSLGVVRKPLEPSGSVYAGGEEWSARSADSQPIPRGQPVRVIAREGLTLVVEPDASSSS
ncbi:MAG TPA: nodulation protein NfeD [Candidatus Limnocylindrales bacterium]|nr:nodulation protein NfeD [Candidatus Limnocylindrales bacterium]